MSNTLIITKSNKYQHTLLMEYQDNKLFNIQCLEDDTSSILGNIYIGRVKNKVKHLDALFVEVEKGLICYYEPKKDEEPFFVKRQSPNKLCEGDEIIVQVIKDAHKTKQAALTSNLSFTGKYLVLTTGNKRISFSSKLDIEDKKRLQEFAVPYKDKDFGLIFRTNAKSATENELEAEIKSLINEFSNLLKAANHKCAFTLLKAGTPDYVSNILGQYDSNNISRIITDDKEIYDTVLECAKSKRPEYVDIIEYYQDEQITLNALYGVDNDIAKALNTHVWLKSGAYLVIEATEAMTVIDVNTGKFEGNKNNSETILKVNLEAARQIARQLRLRNISGIIIIDFIDMKEEDHRRQLMEELEKAVSYDPTKTIVVDITRLNLVELTRKRMRKTLFEQLS